MERVKCKICDSNDFQSVYMDKYGKYVYKCGMCGAYDISDTDLVEKNRVLISSYLFEIENMEKTKNNNDYFPLSKQEIEKILNSPLMPHSISDKVLKLLEYINKKTTYFGEDIYIPLQAGYFNNYEEMENILQALIDRNLIYPIHRSDSSTDYKVALTMKGIEYVDEHKSETKTNQCFVAMWFNQETDELWEKAIKPGCLQAGYKPVRIDKHQHNNNIVDEILSGIRKSRFLIADFTGQNRGVYYEAGFAKGLRKEVIQLCRRDYFSGEDEKLRMHFDNSQVNTIIWENGDEENLCDQIQYRIESIFGNGSYVE